MFEAICVAFICVMAVFMIYTALSISLLKKKLETIYEAIMIEGLHTEALRKDLEMATKQIAELREMHRKTKYTVTNIEELMRGRKRSNEQWPKPGEVVELGEIDVNMHMTPAFEKLMEVVEAVGKSSDKASESMEKVENAVRGTHSEWDIDDFMVEEHRWDDSEDEVGGIIEQMIEDGFEGGLGQDLDELDIHMISREEYLFGGQHEFSKHRLWYDTVKNILRCTAGLFNSEEFDPESADFLGDGLFYFGVSSENKNVVYIRNHILKADFMVEKASVV